MGIRGQEVKSRLMLESHGGEGRCSLERTGFGGGRDLCPSLREIIANRPFMGVACG